MSQLQIYNSLTRKKEIFEPLDPAHIKLYACGPTVYNYAHIGNARMAVVFDLLVRMMRHLYPKVTYVSNITDVDDKIIEAARESGEAISDITEKYARIYNEDMAALGVQTPDVQPRATTHIGEMIALIEALLERGHAYEADGHVLFHVPSFKAYGGLSGRSTDDQLDGARVEVASYKKDAGDFVLWKPSHGDEPGWDSPWGFGRPGWHIECSAMAEKHLGLPFDIHGGGADLKFPHHENEIAQSCCAHGHSALSAFAKAWVHNGFVTVNGEKMSKSLGNVALAHDLLKDFDGEVLRLTLLSAHYRQPLDWSEDKVRDQKKFIDRVYSRLYQMADMEAELVDVPAVFVEALCDDLNMPRAIAEISALLQDQNSPRLKGELLSIGALVGLFQRDPSEWLGYTGRLVSDADSLRIEDLIEARTQAKAEKNWARADEIRVELTAMGVVLEDTPQGVKWRLA
jgi:cysteinyl-tRNA synthetase